MDVRYDDGGQPLTVTYSDCILPTADVISRIELLHMETPSPLNPIGVKGAAEAGQSLRRPAICFGDRGYVTPARRANTRLANDAGTAAGAD
jgi:hypothetical protein